MSRHRLRHHCQEIASFVVRQQGEQGRWKEAKALVLALPEADPWDETFAELMAQADASLRQSKPLASPAEVGFLCNRPERARLP